MPQNLKVEAAKFIHENTKNSIDFFRNLDEASVAWICPLLRPMMVTGNSEIYHENNKVDCIYFLQKGKCGMILSVRFNKFKYIDLPERCCFGFVDIFASILTFPDTEDKEYIFNNWIHSKERLFRQFNVAAQEDSELLTLDIEHLWNMKSEMPDVYDKFAKSWENRLRTFHTLKLKAI